MKLGHVTMILGLGLVSASPALADQAATKAAVVTTNVSMQEALNAQQAWCTALLSISQSYEAQGLSAARARAAEVIDTAYGYQLGAVLFKPTLAEAPQTFRTTRAGALAYFVGGDPNYPSDKGFALNGWKKCEVQNAAVFLSGDTATTMGNVTLTDKRGKVTTVDKTWQFLKDDAGRMRIVTHHSSLPYHSR